VLGGLTHRNRRELPDRRQEIISHTVRPMRPNPPEKARLVLPRVPRTCQDGPVLDPDDLLVHEGPELIPHPLNHRLPMARVPAVPCRADRNRLRHRDAIEVLVEVRISVRIVPGACPSNTVFVTRTAF